MENQGTVDKEVVIFLKLLEDCESNVVRMAYVYNILPDNNDALEDIVISTIIDSVQDKTPICLLQRLTGTVAHSSKLYKQLLLDANATKDSFEDGMVILIHTCDPNSAYLIELLKFLDKKSEGSKDYLRIIQNVRFNWEKANSSVQELLEKIYEKIFQQTDDFDEYFSYVIWEKYGKPKHLKGLLKKVESFQHCQTIVKTYLGSWSNTTRKNLKQTAETALNLAFKKYAKSSDEYASICTVAQFFYGENSTLERDSYKKISDLEGFVHVFACSLQIPRTRNDILATADSFEACLKARNELARVSFRASNYGRGSLMGELFDKAMGYRKTFEHCLRLRRITISEETQRQLTLEAIPLISNKEQGMELLRFSREKFPDLVQEILEQTLAQSNAWDDILEVYRLANCYEIESISKSAVEKLYDLLEKPDLEDLSAQK